MEVIWVVVGLFRFYQVKITPRKDFRLEGKFKAVNDVRIGGNGV